jgi:hypothetical protein
MSVDREGRVHGAHKPGALNMTPAALADVTHQFDKQLSHKHHHLDRQNQTQPQLGKPNEQRLNSSQGHSVAKDVAIAPPVPAFESNKHAFINGGAIVFSGVKVSKAVDLTFTYYQNVLTMTG